MGFVIYICSNIEVRYAFSFHGGLLHTSRQVPPQMFHATKDLLASSAPKLHVGVGTIESTVSHPVEGECSTLL